MLYFSQLVVLAVVLIKALMVLYKINVMLNTNVITQIIKKEIEDGGHPGSQVQSQGHRMANVNVNLKLLGPKNMNTIDEHWTFCRSKLQTWLNLSDRQTDRHV